MKKIIYIVIVALLTVSLLTEFFVKQFGLDLGSWSWIGTWVSSPCALLLGILFALAFGATYETFTKLMSKKMLQYSVIGLGFGMNVNEAIASGKEGMLFTIASVFGTLLIGYLIGRKLLRVESQTSYLISAGTAICGGSAIAATGSAIHAKSDAMSVSLGVVFVLNAVALFIFPYIGDLIGMSMKQFGMWAAIAIHDTSSVVGAGSAYDQLHPDMLASEGVSALDVATTIKLTRALWIVVLALITPFFFRGEGQTDGPDAQLGQVVLPVQPAELLAVEQDAAAAVAVADNGEFRAGFVRQLGDAAQVAGAFAGAALNQTMLRDHQGQPPVGDDFGIYRLA